MDRKTRAKAPQRSVAQEGLGEAVLTVTVQDGQATEAINKLRTALSNLSSFSSKESGTASSVGRAIETATDRATASVGRLAETYKRVQTEQQALVRNARTLAQTQQTAAREFLSRGVSPLTTSPAAQRQQQNADAREAIQERRAQNRANQTAGGSGLLSFFRRQEQLQQELRDDAEVQLQRAAAQARRAESFEQRLTQSRQRSARATETAVAAENTRRRADLQGRISSGLIGGAFPLLFGQGPGAALGGLAGGVAGGGAFGFGASLVGTGIGASFDALIARSKELAEALRDPIAAFDQLKAASVLSSRGLETYIDALIKTGQTAKAEQLIRADLTQNVNPTTAAALSQANDELARSFSDVQEKLSGLVSGPAIAFLQWLDDIIDRLPIQGPGGAAAGQLPTAAQARETAQGGRNLQRLGLLSGIAALGAIGFGIGATATGAGAPAGLAALTYGLTTLGVGGVVAGKAQESQGTQAETDIETQKRIAALQKEIEATQQRRVAIQRQLLSFTGDENSAAAQIAQGQNVVLTAQEAILQARKTFLSLPPDANPTEEAAAYKAYKDAIAAARIEVEKLIAANNNQAKNLKRTTDLRERTTGFTSSARQGAELTDALDRARKDYDKAKAATETAVGKDAVAAAQAIENNLGQAWRKAQQDVADYNAELALTAQRQREINADTLAGLQQSLGNVQKLSQTSIGTGEFFGRDRERLAIQLSTEEQVTEAKREQVRLENELNRLKTTGTQTEIDNAAALVEQARARTQLAGAQGGLRLQEFDEKELENLKQKSRVAAEEAAGKAANALKEAANRFIQAAQDVKSAAISLRSSKEGALSFLQPEARRALVNQARADYAKQTGIGGGALAGVFYGMQSQLSDTFASQRQLMGGGLFRELPSNLSDEQVIAAANAARSVTGAQDQYAKANKNLTDATIALAEKDWKVNVQILGAEAKVYGDAVNEALSGLSA